MKFSFLRPALAAGVALLLASCGGGGKATYPINVQVYNLEYPGLVLTTNGQDLAVSGKSDAKTPVTATFPQQIEYGVVYNVVPKTQPLHQNCTAGALGNPSTQTAGLLASIDVVVNCKINTYPISGKITGLTGKGLVLINGSSGTGFAALPDIDTTTKAPKDIQFAMLTGSLTTAGFPYGSTYGVTVLTQPEGQTCTVTGGNSASNNGSGTIDDAIEKAGGVGNILVTCTKT